MNSNQRVHGALNRQSVDRVPIFMWFHSETAEHLGREVEIPASQVSVAMGNDICQAWVGNNYASGLQPIAASATDGVGYSFFSINGSAGQQFVVSGTVGSDGGNPATVRISVEGLMFETASSSR